MSFIHEDPDFADLLAIVASRRNLSRGLVEKDYWVTHSLWALHQLGLEIWFKGGTSLSKGFALVQRFSEDLDLKIDRGAVSAIPLVSNWKSEGTRATRDRVAFFDALLATIQIPGAQVISDPLFEDRTRRSAQLRVIYPGKHRNDLPGVLKPFVLLEVGSARVTPFVECDMTSFIHEELEALGQLDAFAENRPRRVRCVHPFVTLLEKLDAMHRRFPNENADPSAFVRHYEDAARIVLGGADLPALDTHANVRDLAAEMLEQRQIARIPTADDPAFELVSCDRTRAVGRAFKAIDEMFWGERMTLEYASGVVRHWISNSLS